MRFALDSRYWTDSECECSHYLLHSIFLFFFFTSLLFITYLIYMMLFRKMLCISAYFLVNEWARMSRFYLHYFHVRHIASDRHSINKVPELKKKSFSFMNEVVKTHSRKVNIKQIMHQMKRNMKYILGNNEIRISLSNFRLIFTSKNVYG